MIIIKLHVNTNATESNRQIKKSMQLFKASAYLRDAIRGDFKKTGKCNYQLAKDGFSSAMISFALQKNSKYTETINQG